MGPMAWVSADFNNEDEWVYHLTKGNQDEIRKALDTFKGLGLSYEKATKETFPLPKLALSLLKIRDQIYHGRGFVVIRGLDPDAYTSLDFAVVFLGISNYIAERRGKQDQQGSMMNPTNKETNPSRDKQPFHADVICDTLAIATRSCSARDGRAFVASSWSVYNELASTRPDLINVLATPNWPHDTYGRSPPFYNRALLYHTDGKIILNFSRRLLTGHSDSDIPDLIEKQVEAITAVHFTAPKYQIEILMKVTFDSSTIWLCSTAESLSRTDSMWERDPALKVAWARVFDDTERGTYWDAMPVWLDGKIIKAESCD
ncbi:uncharacterized protein RAG0_05950 [Rhynchosporium agropyri]|uniref:TauD/TfdA-like domain-containing protein n=1 Tax=Rhynchosporium agropyri TaxID=914238 RepID=A0A1E1KFB9_9HELO|nr:uncharacterized protein RAG0_05950 [Rhynchosporium agropyri]